MSYQKQLNGLYVITDDILTPSNTMKNQVEQALQGGAKLVQLRNKTDSIEIIRDQVKELQELCHSYDALFVLNDDIDLAIQLQCDGLHIGKSDHHRFEEIRQNFQGIIGVSCYGDIKLAKSFQDKGADYVAFGSFFRSPTKPTSNIVPLEVLKHAKKHLDIPICAIGGITSNNVDEILEYEPDMICLISDIWGSDTIQVKARSYATKLQ